MGEFEGRVALVTGGALGIGKGIVEAFAREGAGVAIADIDAEAAGQLASTIATGGGRAVATIGDVSVAADAERMVAETVANLGRLDVLVNNAGIQPVDWYFRVEDTPEEVWDRILGVNLKGTFLMSKYAIPAIRAAGGGAVVNMASVQGLQSMPRVPSYAASKGGVLSLTRNMALDYAREDIRVNAICPGTIDSELVRTAARAQGGDIDENLRRYGAFHPIGRLGVPEDIAQAVLFLASDRASFITGEYLCVDGGFMAQGVGLERRGGRMTSLEELRRQVGDLSQVISARTVRLTDGNEDGVRAVDVRVSGGLSALVLLDRGTDLGPAWVAGQQLSWQSTTGIVGAAHFDESNWLRSFHGGLLVTCGLQNVGPPNEDQGVQHGIHGRVSHIPAREVSARTVEVDGRLVAEVTGIVRETDVYGADLVLHRRLRFPLGEPLVEIADEVENRGFAPADLMLLYHVNVGYPVVAPGSRLVAPDAEVVPRDEPAAALLAEHADFPAPGDGFEQLVYEHRLRQPEVEWASIAVVNPTWEATDGVGVRVEYDPRQLPHLWQWRMLAPGMYLTGLEPATCGILGRAAERERGTLVTLEPGERRPFDVTIRALIGTDARAAVVR